MYLVGQFLLLVTLGTGLLALRRWIAQAHLQRKHGCKEVPLLTGGVSLFGIDISYLLFNKSKTGLEKLPLGKQFELLGSTFRTQMSIKPLIRTIDPRNVQAVFSSDASSYGNRLLRYFAFSPLVGNGVMTLDGSPHEHARALIRPTFSKAHIENEAAYDRHVQKLINSLKGDGSTIDLQPLFERLDLDSSTEFIFGESVASLDDVPDSLRAPHRFPAAFNIAQRGMGARFSMLPFNIFHRDKQFWDACWTIRRFVADSVQSALARRRESGNQIAQKYILVDNLLQETQDFEEIQDTLMNVFLPGHDTVAITLSNIFFHLARHPDAWRKLRQQVLSLPEITTENVKRLEYLNYVINETFRVNPPVSNMTRIAVKDTVLPTGGGADQKSPVFVPKGTVVGCSFHNLHRRSDIYADRDGDTETWRPERWENLKLPQLAWKFMPFGGGAHICPAQILAFNRVAFTVARLVSSFERIENRDPVTEFVPAYKLVTASQNGVKVALYRT